MAYQNASAADAADLLDRLRLFLLANGWAVDFWGNQTAVTGKALSVSKAGLHATFLSQTSGGNGASDPAPYLGVIGHTGHTPNANPATQAAASPPVYCNAVTGPFVGYDFFEGVGRDGPYVHVVIETQAGHFKHLGTGILDREGVYTSGQYTFASRWNYGTSYVFDTNSPYHATPFDSAGAYAVWGYVRADADGATPQWLMGSDPQTQEARAVSSGLLNAPGGAGNYGGVQHGPARSMPSAVTGRTLLLPCLLLGERAGGFFSPLGAPPDVRHVRLDHHNPKDVITLGTTQWRVYPNIRKNGVATEPNSGAWGLAYRVAG